jgi:hypothetical protein
MEFFKFPIKTRFLHGFCKFSLAEGGMNHFNYQNTSHRRGDCRYILPIGCHRLFDSCVQRNGIV